LLCGRPHWGAGEEKMKRLLILALACLILFLGSCSKNKAEIIKLNDRISEFELKNQELLLAPGEINHFGPIENRQLQTNKKSHCHNS
jgi:hypothetical protein